MTELLNEETFDLEPSPPGGLPPDAVIRELRALRVSARAAVSDFKEAVKQQAEKYDIKPGALRRYVVALEDDTLTDVEAELHDLELLIDKET